MDNLKLRRLRNYLHDEIGIYVDDEKLQSIYKRKLTSFIAKEGYSTFEGFYKDLMLKKGHLKQELINLFTVNETYFFREKHQFDSLVEYILPELHQKRNPTEVISILCAPVSTGEELYSIAIMILEEHHLIEERDFLLLGIDIDSEVIKKAKEGVFSSRSVHKLPPELIEKYFIKEGDNYRVKDILKSAVNFKVVNVMDKYALKRLGRFDVIFSRNMLIYFDDKSKREVIANFYAILKDEGYLFLGHAERIPKDIKLFKMLKIGESFVYKKVSDTE
ncbi:MAG: protein-glutamate O-methyltransferase CheR [Epsilonproteobacteria bacterium]|nr:protein-glutamate O-methyltransferase CheR [Campylobacterota bacterium]